MKWFLILIPILSLSSLADCQDMRYTVAQNVPLLTQKNELRLSATTGTETYGFQGAYAISKALAVIGGYSNGVNDFSIRNSWEFAIGYFESNENSPFEIYCGAERYYRNFTIWSDPPANSLPSEIIRTHCTIPFAQLDALTYKARSQRFTGSFKIGYIIYDHFSSTEFSSNGANISQAIPNSAPFFEPCITYRLGLNKISFQAQMGLTFLTPMTNFDAPVNFFMNIGISLKLFDHFSPKITPAKNS